MGGDRMLKIPIYKVKLKGETAQSEMTCVIHQNKDTILPLQEESEITSLVDQSKTFCIRDTESDSKKEVSRSDLEYIKHERTIVLADSSVDISRWNK